MKGYANLTETMSHLIRHGIRPNIATLRRWIDKGEVRCMKLDISRDLFVNLGDALRKARAWYAARAKVKGI
jgi:hypothetical protein